MKATFISKEKNDVKFSMEFSPEELEAEVIKVYQSNKDKFEIDGFRKGKAPRSIIEKKYGEGVFLEDAVNNMIGGGYPGALDELGLKVIDSPRVEFSKVEKGTPFKATITVEVYPEIEVKNYSGVEIEKIEGKLEDGEVDQELEKMQKRNGRMVAVERSVKEGDTVLLDYKGFVGDKQFEGGTAEKFPLKIGSGSFIPGFEEQLIGAEVGVDMDVRVTFPEEYHAEDLAGQEAVFKCLLHEIKEEELPTLDDEFAKDVSEFDTLEELKVDLKKKLQESKDEQAKLQMKDKVLEKVFEANDIDVPQVMVEDEINNMAKEFEQQLRGQSMDLNQYLSYVGKEMSEFRGDLKEDALKRVKTRMIVSAIADEEKLEASESEVEQEIQSMADQYKMEVDKIKGMMGVENLGLLKQDLKMRKAIDIMFDNAVIK